MTWLDGHFREPDPVARVVQVAGIPERSVKRRVKAATGVTLMEYVQNRRIEEAKRQLETGDHPFDAIAAAVGCENPGFFRRRFKRATGLTPSQYRKMFQSIGTASMGET